MANPHPRMLECDGFGVFVVDHDNDEDDRCHLPMFFINTEPVELPELPGGIHEVADAQATIPNHAGRPCDLYAKDHRPAYLRTDADVTFCVNGKNRAKTAIWKTETDALRLDATFVSRTEFAKLLFPASVPVALEDSGKNELRILLRRGTLTPKGRVREVKNRSEIADRWEYGSDARQTGEMWLGPPYPFTKDGIRDRKLKVDRDCHIVFSLLYMDAERIKERIMAEYEGREREDALKALEPYLEK